MDIDDSLFGEGSEDRESDSSVVLEDAGNDTKKPYVASVCDHEVPVTEGRHYWASVSDVASLPFLSSLGRQSITTSTVTCIDMRIYMYVHYVTRITRICMHAHIHMREGGEIHSHTHAHICALLHVCNKKGCLILSGSCKTRMGMAWMGVAPDQRSLWWSSIGPTCSTTEASFKRPQDSTPRCVYHMLLRSQRSFSNRQGSHT